MMSKKILKANGMSSSANKKETVRAVDVRIETNMFYAVLEDGREIGVPYEWFWRLAEATEEQRRNWRLIGRGSGIHWEDIDEDISVAGLLKGHPQKPERESAPAQ